MTHPRKALRDAIRAACEADDALLAVTPHRSWALPAAAEGLPALTILTPIERVDPDTGDTGQRQTDIVVVLKCRGNDDVEDDLDVYAEAIEAAVIEILDGWSAFPVAFYQTTQVRTFVEGGEAKRMGTVEVHFSVTRFSDEGQQG